MHYLFSILKAYLSITGYSTNREKRKWTPQDLNSQSFFMLASGFELMVKHLHYVTEKAGRHNMWRMPHAREMEEAGAYFPILLLVKVKWSVSLINSERYRKTGFQMGKYLASNSFHEIPLPSSPWVHLMLQYSILPHLCFCSCHSLY